MKTRAAISFATVAAALAGACTRPAPVPAPQPTQSPANPNAGRGGPPPTAPGQGAPGQDTTAGRGFPGFSPSLNAPRPYNRVITAEA
jgi:hypothetical protein